MRYKSEYYDTQDSQMYLNHHNRKGERSKIHIREYVHSCERFLEINDKSNKGFLIKNRFCFRTRTVWSGLQFFRNV